MSSTVGKWYWHIHHDVLAERSTEPIGNRRKYIRENKPGREHETRLRLLKPVKSPKVGRAWAECKKARDIALAEYEKIQGPAPAECVRVRGHALAEYVRGTRLAWAEYVRAHDSASAEYRNVLVAIHAEECLGCPWDGRTIFPEAR